MKKVFTIILALIALCTGFYALVRFTELNPEEFFPKKAEKEKVYGTISPEKMQQLYDSLESIYITIHSETDERTLKSLKETQKSLWERILFARNAITKAEAPKSIKEEENDLLDSLIKGISITAAILLTIIIFLIIKITRRSREVEKVTERLKTLQTEPAPPPPLGGIDPTVFSTRFRQAPLPQVKPFDQGETSKAAPTRLRIQAQPQGTRLQTQAQTRLQTQAQTKVQTQAQTRMQTRVSEAPKMRKTAKQRVTEAVQRMVEALESLRKTGKTQAVEGPIATDERLSKTKIRSLNSTRISPPADETTYDRRAREKKQILDWAKQGRTPSEIAKWLELPRDQVETVIRLARERGE